MEGERKNYRILFDDTLYIFLKLRVLKFCGEEKKKKSFFREIFLRYRGGDEDLYRRVLRTTGSRYEHRNLGQLPGYANTYTYR